ncbi:hypothetical protein [Ramlibacter sp. AN1133]|uniref:hypothetical protein n=1 Tax=Ramlibacter sp. AN1133 TaxID=3133429 RepID=UPI0030BF54B8
MGRILLLVALAFWLAPCSAQEYVNDALRPLFHATLLAPQVRAACAEVDPSFATGIDAGLAQLRERHGPALAAARAAAESRVGAEAVEHLAKTLATRFGERLQKQDAAGMRAQCANLVTYLESSASRSRQSLVEESFRKWLARQQQARNIQCAKLDDTARALSRRLLADLAAREGATAQPDLLRADAKMAEHAAAWCLQVQETAAREGIRLAGDFARVRDTAHAISDAALPQLSGRDPAAVVRRGRESALRYLGEADWI